MKSNCEEKLYTIPLPSRLVMLFGGSSAKSILEIGCGSGRACFFLHENGFNVVGIDIDEAQIRLAAEKSKSQGIKWALDFLLNDAGKLCFPDYSFDVVTLLGILTFVSKSERLKIVSEVHRVLRKHGYVFVEEFGRTWENPVYARRYREDFELTGELGTIAVKGENGKILHFGHHFTRQEILTLLKDFTIIELGEDTFTSYYHKNWLRGYIVLAQK